MIQSSVWQAAWAEGKAECRAEDIEAERGLCLEFIKRHHPGLLPKAKGCVDACTDLAALRNWISTAGQLDDAGFARLLGIDRT